MFNQLIFCLLWLIHRKMRFYDWLLIIVFIELNMLLYLIATTLFNFFFLSKIPFSQIENSDLLYSSKSSYTLVVLKCVKKWDAQSFKRRFLQWLLMQNA